VRGSGRPEFAGAGQDATAGHAGLGAAGRSEHAGALGAGQGLDATGRPDRMGAGALFIPGARAASASAGGDVRRPLGRGAAGGVRVRRDSGTGAAPDAAAVTFGGGGRLAASSTGAGSLLAPGFGAGAAVLAGVGAAQAQAQAQGAFGATGDGGGAAPGGPAFAPGAGAGAERSPGAFGPGAGPVPGPGMPVGGLAWGPPPATGPAAPRPPAARGPVPDGRRAAPGPRVVRRDGFAIAADGSYAACLADAGRGWFVERWTLDGPEPYTVALPAARPESAGTRVLPLPDGRVLVRRGGPGRAELALVYPAGSGTGEQALGSVPWFGPGEPELIAPPGPGGPPLVLVSDGAETSVWALPDGGGPHRVAVVPGVCTGGIWLDREGRLLAVDRAAGGRVKTVTVDLAAGGAVSPLLQLTEESDDRLLLAEPDSGLIVVRSDAPGEPRLGWGVLGSSLPVRFPECLRLGDPAAPAAVTPFAAQPGQALLPEACAVALRVDGPFGAAPAVWRPGERRVTWLPSPLGWAAGVGHVTADGSLRLPYARAGAACGVAAYAVAVEDAGRADGAAGGGDAGAGSAGGAGAGEQRAAPPTATGPLTAVPAPTAPAGRVVAVAGTAEFASSTSSGVRPLREAPMASVGVG
jgi:hypothetical protein